MVKKLTNSALRYMVSYTSNEPYNQRGRGYEMKHNLNESKPIFQQIKEQIEASILNDSLQADDKAPSTNELALFHKINPATAAKGINELVSENILYKRRGVGMFVTAEAKDILLNRRREHFQEAYIQPLIQEAKYLGLEIHDIINMIERECHDDEN